MKLVINTEIESCTTTDYLTYVSALPFRTKSDRDIRRLSIEPIFKSAYRDYPAQTVQILTNNHLDSVALANVFIWHILTKFTYAPKLLALGLYDSIDNLQTIGAEMTKLVKRNRCDKETRVIFAEFSALTGYRNPPMKGFDFTEKVRELAHAGQPHGIDYWVETWDTAVHDEFLQFAPAPVEIISFREYIESEKANTAGASSEGRVNYDIDSVKDKSFKARKNYLLDIYTVDELVEMCKRDAGKSTQKAFVKPELGKLRIAVTGDVSNYLIQSYVFYYINHAYTQAPWNSLEETGTMELERLFETVKALAKKYSLPWDFDKFDHQPNVFELLSIVVSLCNLAISNSRGIEDVLWACEAFIKSSESSVVTWKDGQIYLSEVVIDGVQSGIRATSVLGNLWNATITRIVENIIRQLEMLFSSKYIRGDDSALIADTYYSCLMTYFSYNAVNAKGNPYKFSILYENTEFLRVWSDTERNYGYVNRAIPGITQRKPWNSQPADLTFGNIRNSIESLNIVVRRSGLSMDQFRHDIAVDWSERNKRTYVILETPRVYGGPGILDCRNKVATITYRKIAAQTQPNIVFKPNVSTFNRYRNEFVDFDPTDQELKTIQQIRMLARATYDDIPEIVSPLRSYQKTLLRSSMVEISSIKPEVILPIVIMPHDPFSYKTFFDNKPPEFGVYRYLEVYFKRAIEFSRVREFKVMKYMELLSPAFPPAVRSLERRFGMHRSMALDYLFGKVSNAYYSYLNPKSGRLMTHLLSHFMILQRGNRRQFNANFTYLNMHAIALISGCKYYQITCQH